MLAALVTQRMPRLNTEAVRCFNPAVTPLYNHLSDSDYVNQFAIRSILPVATLPASTRFLIR